MTTLAIIADTHIPSRSSAIPRWVRTELKGADHVIHAGDFDSHDAYETVDGLAPDLTAVTGNADPDLPLPTVAAVEIEGQRFVVTHGTGSLDTYEERVTSTATEYDSDAIAVAGHTHQLTDLRVNGTRLLNPGSATGVPPASEASMIICELEAGSIDVTMRVG